MLQAAASSQLRREKLQAHNSTSSGGQKRCFPQCDITLVKLLASKKSFLSWRAGSFGIISLSCFIGATKILLLFLFRCSSWVQKSFRSLLLPRRRQGTKCWHMLPRVFDSYSRSARCEKARLYSVTCPHNIIRMNGGREGDNDRFKMPTSAKKLVSE
jgi:hypothetical protein